MSYEIFYTKSLLSKLQNIFLFFYFFSLNFEQFYIQGLGTVSRLFAIIYSIFIFLEKDINKYIYKNRKFISPLILLLFIILIVSILNINYLSTYIIDFTILFNIIIFVALICHGTFNPGILKKSFVWFAVGCLFTTFFYTIGFGVEYLYGRATIFGDNANTTAIKLSIGTIYFIIILLENFCIKNLFSLLMLPFVINFMFETGSRKGLISFVLSLITIGVLVKTKSKIKKTLLLLVVITGIATTFYFVLQKETLYNRLYLTIQDGDLSERDQIWKNVIDIITFNPLFGVGQTGYYEACINIHGEFISPHNVFLEIMAYSGIIGLFIYIIFIYRTIIISYYSYIQKNELLPFILLIPLFLLLISGQALNVKLCWAIFAILISSKYQ